MIKVGVNSNRTTMIYSQLMIFFEDRLAKYESKNGVYTEVSEKVVLNRRGDRFCLI